jgi:hypothetical protein
MHPDPQAVTKYIVQVFFRLMAIVQRKKVLLPNHGMAMEGADMLAVDDEIGFEKDVEPEVRLVNFYPPEAGFVWSTKSWAEIGFRIKPPVTGGGRSKPADTMVDVALDLDVYKSNPDLEGQNVFFYVNGLRLASRYITRRITVMLELPGAMVRPEDNVLTIETPDASRPADFSGNDTRVLGIQLFSMRVTSG